jgi:hypothetical protein
MDARINLFCPEKTSSVRCTTKIKSDEARKVAEFVMRKANDHDMTETESVK